LNWNCFEKVLEIKEKSEKGRRKEQKKMKKGLSTESGLGQDQAHGPPGDLPEGVRCPSVLPLIGRPRLSASHSSSGQSPARARRRPVRLIALCCPKALTPAPRRLCLYIPHGPLSLLSLFPYASCRQAAAIARRRPAVLPPIFNEFDAMRRPRFLSSARSPYLSLVHTLTLLDRFNT
jgi:hypothetical protein